MCTLYPAAEKQWQLVSTHIAHASLSTHNYMQIFAALVLTLLRTALCCGHGLILCPPGTNSSGVCVPLQRWCASLLYLNPFAAPEERVGDLLSRLTLPEKVNLLQSGPINISSVPRLQVPRTTFAECLHGYCSGTPSSLFPQSISLAATFNPSLVTRVAAAIGMEARAWRNRWEAAGDYYNATNPPPSLSCFAPQINIVRGVCVCVCVCARARLRSGCTCIVLPLFFFFY